MNANRSEGLKIRLSHLTHTSSPLEAIFPWAGFNFFLSNLYTQHGVWIHSSEVKSCMLYWLSQPGTPALIVKYDTHTVHQSINNWWHILIFISRNSNVHRPPWSKLRKRWGEDSSRGQVHPVRWAGFHLPNSHYGLKNNLWIFKVETPYL